MRHHPDFGGTYTAQVLFSRVVDCYFIDLQIPGYPVNSEADHTVAGSANFLCAYFKASSKKFFDFIPDHVKDKTQGVIIHGLFLAHFSYGLQLSRQLDVPLYIVPHGASHPYVFSKYSNSLFKFIAKYLFLYSIGSAAFNKASYIIFTSESELKKSVIAQAHKKGIICPLSVEIPSIYRDNHLFDKDLIRSTIRKSLGFSDQDKILLFFGKITRFKRTLETVRSFVKIKPKKWKMMIIGYSEPQELHLLEEIKTIASNHHTINLLSPVFGYERYKYILASDLFVLFSHRENFGFSVAECSMLGVPVYISKDVDIYPSFLSEKLPKMSFDIASTDDIESAISTLDTLTFEDLAMMGKFCQEKILHDFNFKNFHSRLSRALDLQ